MWWQVGSNLLLSDCDLDCRDALALKNEMSLWTNPGVFIFTSIGGLLIIKLTWGLNVWIWAIFHVNYISILKTTNSNPNTLLFVFVFFFCCVNFYYRIHATRSPYSHKNSIANISPLLLIACVELFRLFVSSGIDNRQAKGL